MTDWKELLRELKKGKKKAQRRFFDLTTDKMMGVAVRYTKDRSGAKDCLQEAYIRIFANIRDFDYRSDEQLFAWMNKIVSREALRWIKRNKKFLWTEDELIISRNGATKAPDYLFEDDLLNHLAKLPEAQRIVFNLFAIEGYSHREIEEITGINEVTSRSHLSRARRRLQEIINRKISIKK